MDLFSWLIVGGVVYVCAVAYNKGKRKGSRQGYHAGRCRGRRNRR